MRPRIELSRDQAVLLLSDGEAGISEWNDHCRVGHGTTDLRAVVLNSADLRGAELSRTDLVDARLFGADLSEAQLSGSDLSDADLREANLSGAALHEASLIQANLNRARLVGAQLGKAKLSYASLIRAELCRADLAEANLNRAHLNQAVLTGASLVRAKLSGAELSSADLSRALCEGADLSEADLRSADLSYADLSHTNLEGADLTGATLASVRLDRAILASTKLDDDVDLMLFDWEMLNLDGTWYRRDAVQSGTQALPRAQAPLRMQFVVSGEFSSAELQALQTLMASIRPSATNLRLEIGQQGLDLVVEARGDLTRAAALGALLFCPAHERALETAPGLASRSQHAEPRSTIAELLTPSLLALSDKLSRVSIRLRTSAELELFRRAIKQYGAEESSGVSHQTVTLLHTRSAECVLLDAIGAEASPPQGRLDTTSRWGSEAAPLYPSV